MIKRKTIIEFLYGAYLFSLFVLVESSDTYLISKLIFAIAAGMSLLFLIFDRKPIRLSFPGCAIGVFTFMCFISCLYSDVPDISLEMSITMAQLWIMFIIFENTFRNYISLESFVNMILIAGLLMCIILLFNYGVSGYIDALKGSGRIGSDFENVNTIGGTAAYVILACWYKILFEKKKLYYGIMVLPALIILGAGSKTAIIIALVGVLFMSWYNLTQKNISKQIQYFLVLPVVAIVLFFVIPSFGNISFLNSTLDRFNTMIAVFTGQSGLVGSTYYRIKMVQVGWEMFLNSPLWGNGINGTRLWLAANGVPYTVLHNNYIELLADLGLIGFIAYYSIYLWIIKKLSQLNDTKVKAFAYSMVIMMLVLDVGGIVYYQQRQYFFFSALVAFAIVGGNNSERIE